MNCICTFGAALVFVRAYYRITDPKARHSLFELVKALANTWKE